MSAVESTFEGLKDRWHPRNREKVWGVLQYVLTDAPEGEPTAFWVDFGETGQSDVVIETGHRDFSCTFTVSHADYMGMTKGDLDSKTLFGTKRLLITGSAKMAAVLYRAHVAAKTKHTFKPIV